MRNGKAYACTISVSYAGKYLFLLLSIHNNKQWDEFQCMINSRFGGLMFSLLFMRTAFAIHTISHRFQWAWMLHVGVVVAIIVVFPPFYFYWMGSHAVEGNILICFFSFVPIPCSHNTYNALISFCLLLHFSMVTHYTCHHIYSADHILPNVGAKK